MVKITVGYYFQSKTSTPIPCPVDCDHTVPLMMVSNIPWNISVAGVYHFSEIIQRQKLHVGMIQSKCILNIFLLTLLLLQGAKCWYTSQGLSKKVKHCQTFTGQNELTVWLVKALSCIIEGGQNCPCVHIWSTVKTDWFWPLRQLPTQVQ